MTIRISGWIGGAILGFAVLAMGGSAPALVFEPLPYAYDALGPYIDARAGAVSYKNLRAHETGLDLVCRLLLEKKKKKKKKE